MADVHILPGVTRFDIGPDVDSETILRLALEANVERVIVIGYNRDGFYLASASPDLDQNAGMLMRAVNYMMHTDGPVDPVRPPDPA